MYIKLFEEFGEENVKELHYMSFDIDDNLLHTNTKLIMDHLIDGEWVEEIVDTEKFAQVRGDKNWRYKPGEGSFLYFRDYGPNGDDSFIIDFKEAVLNKRFAPSWFKFIECLVNGNIFSIITSRGHSPKNVRIAIEWLIYEYGLDKFKKYPIKNVDKSESFEDQMIDNLLRYHELFGSEPDQVIDEYLDHCPIYTVNSSHFRKKFGDHAVEIGKKLALRDFNQMVKEYAEMLGVRAKYGFSDDDPRFVKGAAEEFTKLKNTNKNIDYSVFDTGGDRKIKKFM